MSSITVQLNINILSFWHAGSGLGRGADADALVLKDASGLPYLPGRTVKGLLREGLQTCEDAGFFPKGRTDELFGTASVEGSPLAARPGLLFVSDARLSEAERGWLASPDGEDSRSALFETFSSTSLDANGMALDHTLRTVELCVPLDLAAEITGPPGNWKQDLAAACDMVRGLGSHRNRGLGRCRFSVS